MVVDELLLEFVGLSVSVGVELAGDVVVEGQGCETTRWEISARKWFSLKLPSNIQLKIVKHTNIFCTFK